MKGNKLIPVKKAVIKMTKEMQKLINICYVQQDLFTGIAPPQFGKSTAIFMIVLPDGAKLYYFQLTKSMSARRLFSLVLNALLEKNTKTLYSSYDIFSLIERCAELIEERAQNAIFVFDEAGSFGAAKLPYLRELYDRVRGIAGILMLGPEEFQKDIDLWIKQGRRGIAEIFARSKPPVELPSVFTYEDIENICLENNFPQTKLIDFLYQESRNLKDVNDSLFNLLNGRSGLTSLLN